MKNGVIFILILLNAFSSEAVDLVAITEDNAGPLLNQLAETVKLAEMQLKGRATINMGLVTLFRDNEEESFKILCGRISNGVSLVVDLTWSGWYQAKQLMESAGVPYFRADVTIRPFVQALDDYLMKRNGTDAALIFHSEAELDQALYYMIGNSIIRIIVLNTLDEKNVKGLFDMRPTPSFHAIFGTGSQVMTSYKKAVQGNIVQREGRWNLITMDGQNKHQVASYNSTVSFISFEIPQKYRCRLLGQPDGCTNTESVDLPFQSKNLYLNIAQTTFSVGGSKKSTPVLYAWGNWVNKSFERCHITKSFLENLGHFLGALIGEMLPALEPKKYDCTTVLAANADNSTQQAFDDILTKRIFSSQVLGYSAEDDLIYTKMGLVVNKFTNNDGVEIGTWTTEDHFQVAPGQKLDENRRFFRIGVVDDDEPWSYQVLNETTGQMEWVGYCIDLAKKLADNMQFDYEFSKPIRGKYGKKQPNGKWDGLVGDLARGETDIVVAALMMTSEREEVIDFVAPYFDQSGISIMIRKPVRVTSLFKFMTVLRTEVWVSIVGALTVTGIMIWLLDKYSPYSARNNKEMYPYPCREFTLKESFWFALTSFTPQGGGEAPKALSGRTLVAAYWLFVVLMLATFTANLAAFLTVERMKSPVESLEQLARQSKINYTVVANGDAHQFFKNMKAAEDTLYKAWKELTLNATSDQTQYRVWDYPIKEQYGHILLAIENTGPVPNEATGIQKVLESSDAEFAFIHDAQAIRYQVYKNCNLTEVGEVFAERPYAVAVQQGSQLQEEISRKILDLQKDRYFETESQKYWNPNGAGKCPNTDDSEGITLGSLGGVFIATLFGLALAMVTLAGEILYHKHKHKIDKKLAGMKLGKGKKINSGENTKDKMKEMQNRLAFGDENWRNFRNLDPSGKMAPKVSYISVFPRNKQPYD